MSKQIKCEVLRKFSTCKEPKPGMKARPKYYQAGDVDEFDEGFVTKNSGKGSTELLKVAGKAKVTGGSGPDSSSTPAVDNAPDKGNPGGKNKNAGKKKAAPRVRKGKKR